MAVKFIKGSEVESSLPKGVAIVNVTATWCGPCKMFGPILEEVSNTTPVFKVDLDENRDYAQAMQVQGVPTTFIMKDGKVADKLVGFLPLEEVTARLAKVA